MVNYKRNKTCSLFGHRKIFLPEKLSIELEKTLRILICQGYTNFYIGNHGDFDRIALGILKKLKNFYDIVIHLVITNPYYKNIDTNNKINIIMYDIENKHPKSTILYSNFKTVDKSDLVIFYLDLTYDNTSGSKRVFNYAMKKHKDFINIFELVN